MNKTPLLLTVLALTLACAPTQDDADALEPWSEESSDAESYDLQWRHKADQATNSPLSLTASDGTGLRLRSYTARAVLEDPLALTELTLVFENPENRVREGRFEINLPPGAAVSRLAMKIDGRWQEAEVVERQAARRAYEDFLHRRQDPALMEKKAGNQFRARVFPIPANGVKEIKVAYSQEIRDSGEPYRVLLKGLPELDELDVDVAVVRPSSGKLSSVAGATASTIEHMVLREKATAPTSDLEVRVEREVSQQALRHRNMTVARVAPKLVSAPLPIEGLTILFDTSASRALGYAGQVERLGRLVDALAAKGDFELSVVAFDQTTESIYAGPASGFGSAEQKRLMMRQPLGASDLEAAVRALPGHPGLHERVLLVSDGISTAGESGLDALALAVQELGDAGVVRFDALVDGGIVDESALEAMAEAPLPQTGVVASARLTQESLVHKLTHATRSDVEIAVEGAKWQWPRRIASLQEGDEFLVYAQLEPGAELKVRVGEASAPLAQETVPTKESEGALLRRAWAQATVEDMSAELRGMGEGQEDERRRLREQIVKLSVSERVLSDYTALLVLETEQDYARFGIDRRSLVDILSVGPTGVEVIDRKVGKGEPVPQLATDEPEPESRRRPRPTKKAKLDADDGIDAFREWPEELEEAAHEEAETLTIDMEQAKSLPVGNSTSRDFTSVVDMAPTASQDAAGVSLAGSTSVEMRGEVSVEAERSERSRRRPRRRGRRARAGTAAGTAAPPPSPAMGAGVPAGAAYQPVHEKPQKADAWTGRYASIQALLASGKRKKAVAEAWAWRMESPGSQLALLALGEAAETVGESELAERAYGSLIDLFPSRADIRRMAGSRLERLALRKGQPGLELAIDTYRRAVEERPDHPSSHRNYAYALLKARRHHEAWEAILAAIERQYPGGRFLGVRQVLMEDAGIIAAVYLAAEPKKAAAIRQRAARAQVRIANAPSTRFVLTWETDANDVDFHIHDARGGHAWYSSPDLPSGGSLYADVTTGYGPECFTIAGKPKAYPYTLQAHYYSRGPMGYGMGRVQTIEHDGRGGLWFDEQPFVIMKDGVYVDLGVLDAPLSKR